MLSRVTRRPRPTPGDPRALRAPRVLTLSATPTGSGYLVRATAETGGRWFYWFVDGAPLVVTPTPELYRPAAAAAVECVAAARGDYDPERWTGRELARRWLLEWVRPTVGAVDDYGVEWATGKTGGTWSEFARVADRGAWSFQILTPELSDVTWYRFRVVPYTDGNAGDALEWPARQCVRTPDADAWAAAWDAANCKISIVAG